jgi:hypothetical protein
VSAQEEYCTHCVRDLVMHPPEPAFITVSDYDGGNARRCDRLTWEEFEELFARGKRIQVCDFNLFLGGYGKFMVDGNPLCYAHTWMATAPPKVIANPKRLHHG